MKKIEAGKGLFGEGLSFGVVVILGLFFFVGLVLRLNRLELNKPPVYGDEAGGNYLYWFQLQTSGNILTKIRGVIMSYTWVFGLTPLATRLPSAIYGAAGILGIFGLAKALSKDNTVALVTAGLGTVIPWLFMLSRIGFAQIPIVVILLCLHVVIFICARRLRDFLASMVLLVVAAFLYPSLIIIAPIVFAYVCIRAYTILPTKNNGLVTVSAFLAVAVVGVSLFGPYKGFSLESRGIDTAIWRDVNVAADSNLYRGLARLSEPTIFSFGKQTEAIGNKIVYNFPGSVLGVFFRNYLTFFSPEFLFLKGDTTLRQSTGMTGSFFLALLPFMVYGLYLLVAKGDKRVRNVVLLWILVSPIPGAITKDGPGYLLRVVTMMPFLTYLSALGVVRFLEALKPKVRLVAGAAIGLAFVYSSYSFLFGYFHVYPALAAKNYEYGFKELSEFQFSRAGTPILVVWDGYYPNLYFRFWQKTPAKEYLAFRPVDINFGGSVFHQMFPNLYFSLPRTVGDLDGFLRKQKVEYWAVSADFLVKNPGYRQPEKTVVQVIKYPNQADDFVIYKSL